MNLPWRNRRGSGLAPMHQDRQILQGAVDKLPFQVTDAEFATCGSIKVVVMY